MGVVLSREMRVSKPVDAASRQEIERKRIKREIDDALKLTAKLRAAVQEISDYYEVERRKAERLSAKQ